MKEYKDMTERERFQYNVKTHDHMRKCDWCKTQYPPEDWKKMRWSYGNQLICDKASCEKELKESFDEHCREQAEEDKRREDYD